MVILKHTWGGLTELKLCRYKLVRPTDLKTWIPTVHGLKFMTFLADLKIFHFGALEVVSKSESLSWNGTRDESNFSWKSWFLTSKPNLGTTHSLNCPKDAKNGFFGKFYIDIVNRKFSQLFFFGRKNFSLEDGKYFSENKIFW